MSDKIGIIYWCFGAGHTARIIPLAKELRSRGVDVSVAGGGAGKDFVEMNGFEQPGLTEISVDTNSHLRMVRDMIFDALPSTVKRTRDINSWMKREKPDKLVTDDPLAVFVAAVQGVDVYRVEHLEPDILGPFWGTALSLWNSVFKMIGGEKVVVTCLWPEEENSSDLREYVGPLAQEGDDNEKNIDSYDVLLSPGTFGEDFEEIREKLEEKDLDVRTVGDDDWETTKTMAPYTEAADCVVCAGFSSIADAVVPGTPTVIYPFIPGQKAIAGKVDDKEIKGIETAYSTEQAVKSALSISKSNTESPDYENGASKFADILLEDKN
ncbi:MAG: glycosyltransferase [Candidatus Nanosalina sp.]